MFPIWFSEHAKGGICYVQYINSTNEIYNIANACFPAEVWKMYFADFYAVILQTIRTWLIFVFNYF